ncbi:cell division control protein [Rhypophila decipiens]
MAILGKRTRSSRAATLDTVQELPPTKRTRRSVQEAASDLEKKCTITEIAVDDLENQENRQPEPIEEPVAYTPSKSKARRVSVAISPTKTPLPVTPSTPRHYDVFAKPTTPRHRVMSVGKLSRRLTPQTPLTPSSCQTVYHQARQLFSRSADPGQLIGRDEERTKLRGFLHRCTTAKPGGCLYVSGPPGTGKSALVNEVTQEVVAASTGGAIKKAYINCMSIKSSKDLYLTLLGQLGGEDLELSESDLATSLQKLIMPKKKTTTDVFLVVLDEIDHILTLDPESLYRVFEWSLQKTSRLALIGIANALDLTDRFLPRLKSRNLKPDLLPILPYTAQQIKGIIVTRLKTLLPAAAGSAAADPNFLPFFHPAAIELCCRKVSTQTGDLRRAFEILRRSIDLVESETRLKHENEVKEQLLQMSPSKKAVLGENRNLASSSGPTKTSGGGGGSSLSASLVRSLQSLTVENAPRVSIAHLNKVTAAAFSHGTNQRLKTLNLQQKAALCSLMAIEKRNRALAAEKAATMAATPSSKTQVVAAPTVKALYDIYSVLCTRDSVLHPLSSSEFREVIGSLETLSLISEADGKTGSFRVSQTPGGRKKRRDIFANVHGLGDEKRVASCVGEKEMETALEAGAGVGILMSILSGEALD